MQFEGVGALRAKMSSRDWRCRIAFDRDQLPLLVIHELAAADPTIWADRTGCFGAVSFRTEISSAFRHRLDARSIGAVSKLLNERPAGEKFSEHEITFCISNKGSDMSPGFYRF